MNILHDSNSFDTISLYGVYVPNCEELFNRPTLDAVQAQLNKKPSGFLDATRIALADIMADIMGNDDKRGIYIDHIQELLEQTGAYKSAVKLAYAEVLNAMSQALMTGIQSGEEYTKYNLHNDLLIMEGILQYDVGILSLIYHNKNASAYEISDMIHTRLVKTILSVGLGGGDRREGLSKNFVRELEKSIERM